MLRAGLVVGGLLLGLLLAETVLQIAVRVGTPSVLADPESYAHPLCDPWYWRTRAQQGGPAQGRGWRSHPRLGWLPPSDQLDDQGVRHPDPSATGPAVILLGDSFMAGTTPVDERIPTLVQRSLARRQRPGRVEDHAVGGHGLDQIVLRFLDRAAGLAPGSPVIIGVLTTDIDRTVFYERDAPKPRFRIGDGEQLVLEVDHLTEPMPPPGPMLLLPARFQRLVAGRRALASGLPHPECRVSEKRALASALMKTATQTCSERDLRCLVVPFLRAEDLARPPGWREALLETQSAAVEVLRLRPLLKAVPPPLYGDDRHPSVGQNQAIAQAIAAWVETTMGPAHDGPPG